MISLKNKKIITFSITGVVIVLFILGYLFLVLNNIKMYERKAHYTSLLKLTYITDNMQKKINRSFEYVEFLDLMIKLNSEELIKNFNSYAKLIYENNKDTYNIQLAPNSVVSYVSPNDGQLTGYSLLEMPNRREYVMEAIKTRRPISQGPVKSIQGEVLVFNRKAVYIDDKYWGLAIVSMDFEKLIEDCGISLEDENYSYAIRARMVDSAKDFVWGNKEIFEKQDCIIKEIDLSNQNWEVAIYPKIDRSDEFGFFRIFNLFVLITMGIIVTLLYLFLMNYFDRIESSKQDHLTKTLNITTFKKIVNKKIQKNKKFALLLFDANDFKYINDTYGHPIGDAVIIEMAKRLKNCISKNDLISRLGGDEYVIYLNDVESEGQVQKVCDAMMDRIKEDMVFEDLRLKTSISVGYSLFPDDADSYEDLYKKADSRMYICKMRNKGLLENDDCYDGLNI